MGRSPRTNNNDWRTSYLVEGESGELCLPEEDSEGDRWAARWPVFAISWLDAVAYCGWLSERDGLKYRLPSEQEWESSVEAFQRDLEKVKQLVSDPAVDLLATIPHGDGQTVLRETMLVVDHNAYHLGQLVTLRRLLGDWGKD